MKTIVVYARTAHTGKQISACATHIGLPQIVKAVDCIPALFIALRRGPVDVVLVDVALAAPDPVKFTRTVRTRYPRTGVLFTGAADPRTAATVAAAGALGFIKARSGGADDLLVAFAHAIVLARTSLVNTAGDVPRQRPLQPLPMRLSEREVQVLAGLTEGKPNAEIGRDLFVSEDTVKTHAKRLYRKLGARDRAHAVAIAFRSGLIS
ncbi:response regulator transcription factor [Glycomyces buryatensis]|uniref:Response regulator transcription factor n=1 Tax=Glycomyces buryatensis TaxID=2570927 RepID=A0A4S8QD29_9ACTN|nr:response regulator transcription factor [Glycomyces buryatensis]